MDCWTYTCIRWLLYIHQPLMQYLVCCFCHVYCPITLLCYCFIDTVLGILICADTSIWERLKDCLLTIIFRLKWKINRNWEKNKETDWKLWWICEIYASWNSIELVVVTVFFIGIWCHYFEIKMFYQLSWFINCKLYSWIWWSVYSLKFNTLQVLLLKVLSIS